MLKMTVEKITPEKAKEYLKLNVRNVRSMSRSVIRNYAEDMANGKWRLNGEAICFDEEGYLKNGQHRLSAIVMAGIPVEMAVIRGVGKDVTLYDVGSRRTISQIVNADEKIECNSTIASAANLIVNNFRPGRIRGVAIDYIRNHFDELERAYRITCYGGDSGIKSRCGPCVAASYLALRTFSIPCYELELFFRIFNANGNCQSDGYDPTPCTVARKMFEERGKNSTGYQIQKEKLEIITLAIQDFHENIRRAENYRISEPFRFQEWMDTVRKEDGLE